MPRSEPENEFISGREFCPSAPELNECAEIFPCGEEFREDASAEAAAAKAHETRKRSRMKRNLLLQAGAVIASVVLVTSSFGKDILAGAGADSEELTRALESGGAGRGAINVSMIWDTEDDVDLHVITPSGAELCYSSPTGPGGGALDVDMQVNDLVEHPVENIFFTSPELGEYRVFIVNYTDRDLRDPNVLVRVTAGGSPKEYRVTLDEYSKEICTFKYGG